MGFNSGFKGLNYLPSFDHIL